MARNNLMPCLAIVLGHEGGKVDDFRDPGGRTNQGVTQRAYDLSRKARGEASRTVYAMTPDERDAIYRAGYWDRIGAETLAAGVDLATFDPAVNSGPARALAWLHAAQRKASGDLDVIDAICSARLSFLHALTTWRAFGRGWGDRVADIEAKACRMARGQTPAASAAIVAKASAASAKAARGRAQSRTTAGGAVVGPATTQAATGGHHFGLILVIGLIVLAGAGILAFAAWRQSQRATALTLEAGK